MPSPNPDRARIGALALATSALFLMTFPLVRPFFPLDVFAPARTLDVGGPPLASAPWVVAHLLGMGGFALLPLGLLALYARLADGDVEPRALRGLVKSVGGISLVLPAFGVETFSMPLVARTYLAGTVDVAPMLSSTYRGPMTLVMLLGLALLAAGAGDFARAIRRDGTLPGWAAITFALGLAFWLPLFPRPIRVIDGVMIGIGGLALARALWKRNDAPEEIRGVVRIAAK